MIVDMIIDMIIDVLIVCCFKDINADLPESQMGPPSPPCDDQRPLSPRGYSPINPKTVLGVRVD